ncbi:hypothetical protein OG730_18050 [Streptomyces sp. NBC_01298]|uniref:hypothetical protein n=1 Tax=Streptomyces sp. NBC_01298 TaxID=2903817 RepID=UPI002E0E0D86|nr:hypothetical protein OG730_18050 [Streptomyces sp. NBC_01298]
MGNSRAYPVFRTTDATAAYAQAMRLCALLAEHHTVFVHVGKWGDLPRAGKLAARIGGEVLGEEQLGW